MLVFPSGCSSATVSAASAALAATIIINIVRKTFETFETSIVDRRERPADVSTVRSVGRCFVPIGFETIRFSRRKILRRSGNLSRDRRVVTRRNGASGGVFGCLRFQVAFAANVIFERTCSARGLFVRAFDVTVGERRSDDVKKGFPVTNERLLASLRLASRVSHLERAPLPRVLPFPRRLRVYDFSFVRKLFPPRYRGRRKSSKFVSRDKNNTFTVTRETPDRGRSCPTARNAGWRVYSVT